jgi:hypothetical protein
MAKKPKAPKTPRVKGGGKDAITGLDLGNGLILKSDTVYTDQSPEYRALFGTRNSSYAAGGGTHIEFEFGSNAIFYTAVTTGELAINGNPQTTPDYKSRAIGLGSFTTGKGGLLKNGVINEATEWSYTPARPGSSTNGAQPESESIISYKSNTKFSDTQLKSNPSSIFYAFTGSQPVFWYDSYIQPELSGEFDQKSDFTQLASSKYLTDGWWNNPFAPNLI